MKLKLDHSRILWIAAVCSYPLMIWPLLYAATTVGAELGVRTIFRDADPMMALEWLIPCIAVSWIGIGAARLRRYIHEHNEKEQIWKTALGNLVPMIPFLAIIGWLILTFRIELVNLLGVLSMVFCALYALNKAFSPYADIISRIVLVISLGCGLACMAFIAAMHADYSSGWLIWPFFIEAIICAVAQNQGNIDFMMRRRKHDMRHLPRQVRWYNLMVTSAILLLILAVVVFRPQITWAFGRILDGVKFVLRYIILLILWLLGLQEAKDEVPAGAPEDSGGMDLSGLGGGEGSPWWDYIMYTILAVVTVWLLWTYRSHIARSIRGTWRKIVKFIKDKLFAVPAVQKLAETIAGSSEYYTDETEILTPDEYLDEKEEVFKLRDWRRKVKKLNGQTPSPERYRGGYKLGLEWLSWKGVQIAPADTPADILKKAKAMLPSDQWKTVTRFYELVRYAEQDAPAAEQTKLFELLLSVSKR